MSADQKTRRRSSFTANRVSLLSRDVSSAKDLHKMVEEELSKEDRLAKLSRLSLQFTLDMLEKEFKDSEWFEKFKTSADDGVNEVISRLQDEDMFVHACSKKQQLPNPMNEDLNANIAVIEFKIDKLEQESQKWDLYLEELKKAKSDAEKKAENLEIQSSAITEPVKAIATSNYLKPSPDYQDMLQATQNNLNKAALQMESYSTSVHLLERASKLGDSVEEHLTNQLYKESFKGMSTQSSMEQITNLISLPSPSKKTKNA